MNNVSRNDAIAQFVAVRNAGSKRWELSEGG